MGARPRAQEDDSDSANIISYVYTLLITLTSGWSVRDWLESNNFWEILRTLEINIKTRDRQVAVVASII